jgi:hypothetical protein
MAWVKLDDAFFRNPKVLAAGRDARDLYLAGLCFAGAQLTDGLIRTSAIRMLAAEADIDNGQAAALRLIDVGLWISTDDGYQIKDYLDYNPTAEQVKARRAQTAERVEKWRFEHRNAVGNAVTNAVGNEHVTTAPVPLPHPLVDTETPAVPHGTDAGARDVPAREGPAKPPKYTPSFEAFWRSYPRPNGRAWDKPATYAAWRKLRPDGEMADAICAGVAAWRLGRDWQREFVKAPAKFLDGRLWEEPPDPWNAAVDLARASPARKAGTQDILAEAFGRNGSHDSSDLGNDDQSPLYDVALSGKDRAGRAGADGGILVSSPRPDG